MTLAAAGGWDVVVVAIQAIPPTVGVIVLAALLIWWGPDLKKRIGRDDLEVDLLGAKVKLSDASKNLGSAIEDLQNQVAQLISEREERLANEAAKGTPALASPQRKQEGRGATESRTRPQQQPEIAQSETAPPLQQPGGKGAGPAGPGPSPQFPGLLYWIDQNAAERTIERRQLENSGWTILRLSSIEEAAKVALSASQGLSAPPRAVVVASSSALPVGLAGLAGMLPDASIIIYGPGFGNDRFVGVGGARSALLTSSAVGLLLSLTATRCAECGVLIPEASILPVAERKPCPNCGSTDRVYSGEPSTNG